MKLIFFLVAFCLVCIRVFIPWTYRSRERHGDSFANMVINSGNFKEEINYNGKFVLTEDEQGFKSISPGGYVKFHVNDTSVKAESNLKGDIDYSVYEGHHKITDTIHQKSRIAWAIREMVYWGFDSDNRMERVFRRGGAGALLNQVDSVHSDPLRAKYLERVLSIDSLSVDDQRTLVKKMASMDFDPDKAQLLNKISIDRLQDSATRQAYFQAIESLRGGPDKFNVLRHVIDQDSVGKNLNTVITIAGGTESDLDKANLFNYLIQNRAIQGDHLDSLMAQIARLSSGIDKTNLYRVLMGLKDVTESQWINLLNAIGHLDSDLDKGQLLVEIAGKMPKTEQAITAFHAAAKTINNDMDYGRVMRAIE